MKFKNRVIILISVIFIISLSFTNSCSRSGIKVKSLPESDRKFMNEVSIIITKQEKRRFLSLTNKEDRESFKSEFWKKRDPDPQSDENEFKIEYFNRMSYANKYFKHGRRPGWKTDRGRIYMILGPPTTQRFYQGRIYSNVGKKPLDAYPHIIWLYGDFPVVFVDYNYSNDYRLTSLSARQIGMLNVAGIMLKPKISKEKIPMDFTIDLKRNSERGTDIILHIPISTISFTTEENSDKHSTKLGLTLEFLNRKTKKKVIKKKEYNISLTGKELEKMSDNYSIMYSLKLKKGKYILIIKLKNFTDNKETRKKIKFAIKK